MTYGASLPKLPVSWSGLSWQQLRCCWQVKVRYGGNADVARVAALLELSGLAVCRRATAYSEDTGEAVYRLKDGGGRIWEATPRELSQAARQALPWFDFPYGDPGEKELRDDAGKVVRERRDAVSGYVSPMRDAMITPLETVRVGCRTFALPQVVCNNFSWRQYRSLQGIAPQLFAEGIPEVEARRLQAQFLAHSMVPRSLALLDTTGGSIRIRPHYEYRYDEEQSEGLAGWWLRRFDPVLFHICFQVYQTALTYYAGAYPLLFDGGGGRDPMRDALQGEVGTINTIMKYAGYAEQQQVYDSYVPFVLDILNTMAKEAKEIEKMNAKIRRKGR